ncbi:MAG: SDR family NAD(P)-dependent oxidoreductase [Candidatus Aminicenantales bacterium]
MLLNGKNAVITGCLKGIGRATMDVFAQNGANIWACCQMPTAEFEGHVKELAEANGVSITPVYFDLSDYEQIKAGMKQIVAAKQPVDVLVNIAGIAYNALFHMTTMDKMKEVFEIDFFSQMLITQQMTRLMVRQKSGSVINIVSVAGVDGNPGQVAYSAAKAALIGATKTLAGELGGCGIRVNAVAPGVIQTDMTASLPKDKFDELLSSSKLRRAGLPEEVARALLFLASDQSAYVTGQVIRVDGGMGG